MTDEIDSLLEAASTRDWYAFAVIAVFGAMRLVKRFPSVWERVPRAWQWLPPVAMGAGAGFVDAAHAGMDWGKASMHALTAGLYIGLGAVGTHHAAKRVSEANNGE